MSLKSNWCEFDKETRKYIKKRDNNQCVICHKKGALQIMHIWVNRSHCGKGCKENGVLGCIKCHRILDNPIGEEQNKKSKEIMDYCKKYLIEKENINYDDEFINSLKFNKREYIRKNEVEVKPITYQLKQRCKNCKYLVKNKIGNTSLPTYICTINKKIWNKNNNICNEFKNIR